MRHSIIDIKTAELKDLPIVETSFSIYEKYPLIGRGKLHYNA